MRKFLHRLLAPWRAADAITNYQAGVQELLREVLAVSRAQAETNAKQQASLEAIAGMWLSGGQPERWIAEDDNALLTEMLLRDAQQDERGN